MVSQDVTAAAAEALPRTGGGAGLQQLAGGAQAGAGGAAAPGQLRASRTGLYKIVQVEGGGLGQRLIPLKVAHHLLKARALVEAVRPKCLHLLLRNFARRPFHAPALGPRAQLGHLAAHGLRQPAHGTKGTAEPALLRMTWQETARPARWPATVRGRPPSRTVCAALQTARRRQRTSRTQLCACPVRARRRLRRS